MERSSSLDIFGLSGDREIGFDSPGFGSDSQKEPSQGRDILSDVPKKKDLSKSLPWGPDEPTRSRAGRNPPPLTSMSADDDWLLEDIRAPKAKLSTAPVGVGSGLLATLPASLAPLSGPVGAPGGAGVAGGTGLPALDLRGHEEMMREQQRFFEEQQRQQQLVLERQLQVQQEQLRQQQQQQLQQQQEQLRRQRSQQLAALQQQQELLMQQPLYTGLHSLPYGSSSSGQEELQNRVKQLESEKLFLQGKLELLTEQHAEEKKILQDSFQQRLELHEESSKKHEERLRQENEAMSSELADRVSALEREKMELFATHLRRQAEVDAGSTEEMERLKERHRTQLESMQAEHERALQRLAKVKDFELDAVVQARDHTKTLETAIQKIEENALDLQELHSKVEYKHSSSLTDRETFARQRDEALKLMQERLEREQQESSEERARLKGLVARLENQLTEQAQQLEQERWRLRQEEGVLKALQSSTEQERSRLLEQLERDRSDVDKSRAKLLDQQQTTLKELNKEKIELAEERARFDISVRLGTDDSLRTNNKLAQSEAELAAGLKALTAERARLASLETYLEAQGRRLEADTEELGREKRGVAGVKLRMEELAREAQERSNEMEEFGNRATAAQKDAQRMLQQARQAESGHVERLRRIEADQLVLRDKEKLIAQERLSLAKDRSLLEQMRNSALCSVCRTPIRDTPANAASSLMPSDPRLQAADHMTSLGAGPGGHAPPPSHMTNVYAAIQMDRSVRLWRMNADQDKDFLEEEKYFLEAIRHAPYHFVPTTT